MDTLHHHSYQICTLLLIASVMLYRLYVHYHMLRLWFHYPLDRTEQFYPFHLRIEVILTTSRAPFHLLTSSSCINKRLRERMLLCRFRDPMNTLSVRVDQLVGLREQKISLAQDSLPLLNRIP